MTHFSQSLHMKTFKETSTDFKKHSGIMLHSLSVSLLKLDRHESVETNLFTKNFRKVK